MVLQTFFGALNLFLWPLLNMEPFVCLCPNQIFICAQFGKQMKSQRLRSANSRIHHGSTKKRPTFQAAAQKGWCSVVQSDNFVLIQLNPVTTDPLFKQLPRSWFSVVQSGNVVWIQLNPIPTDPLFQQLPREANALWCKVVLLYKYSWIQLQRTRF